MSDTDRTPDDGEKPRGTVTIDELGLTTTADEKGGAKGPREFLFAWFQLFRTAQIHAIDNKALHRPVQSFIDISKHILTHDGAISFQSKDGTLFLNTVKLSLSSEEYTEAADRIFVFFEERGMGGFAINGTFDVERVHRLLSILVYAPPEERRFKTIEAKLRESGLPFRINKALGIKKTAADAVLERRAFTFLTYSKLVVLHRTLYAESTANPAKRFFLVKKIARNVETLVDICIEDDHTFLGVSSVKAGEAYASRHAVNVAVLSIALGEKLGLRKVALADLGMAAIFSDIGLRDVPRVVLEKGDTLEPAERESLQRHTLQSVKFLLDDKHYTRPLVRRIFVAFEHHREFDGGGYPQLAHPPDLFSRIVIIADAYDSLTTDRPWRKAHLPDEALGLLLSQSGKKFDPLLLKIFVNTLGFYPVGTLVRLTTGEAGLVIYGGGDEERLTHPIVALLGPEGRPTETVDLAEKDPSGRYVREIVFSEDPAKYGLQPSGLLSTSAAP